MYGIVRGKNPVGAHYRLQLGVFQNTGREILIAMEKSNIHDKYAWTSLQPWGLPWL